MKFKLRIASVVLLVLLTMVAAPAWAIQLGQIQVKSALNQPLVASIPLHPKNLSELDGLTVGLASSEDFERAGLQLTPTDRMLRFHVVTDNNGQKLILVTSSQPVTDPYLDFLVQVNTRQGKQVGEFVVLLNPVIAAPAPAVHTAPAAGAAGGARHSAGPLQAGQQIVVHHGDTLYRIAQRASQSTGVSINQMMLALKAANPKAFFKDNINDLKAGAILRIPTRDAIDKTSIAEANAEVHRQYEEWRAAKTHPATEVAGAAAQAAARTAPQSAPAAPASDHLALVPPTGGENGAGSRPGMAGGTGRETVAGLQQQLQNDRGSLASLNQSNVDLESRVQSLKDIADKSDKLLSLKEATVAELQRKLAAVTSGKQVLSAASTAAKTPAAANPVRPPSSAPAKPAKEAENSQASATPWFERPLTWIVAALIVLALILAGLLLRRRRGREAPVTAGGPLLDPEDVSPQAGTAAYGASLQARLAEDPDDLEAYLALCRLYHAQGDVERFVATAHAMHARVRDPGSMEWHEVAVMGEELGSGDPLFAAPEELQPAPEQAQGGPVLQRPGGGNVTTGSSQAPATAAGAGTARVAEASAAKSAADAAYDYSVADEPAVMPVPEARAETGSTGSAEQGLSDDPVDTKLDLARAYLDMGDEVGARAMLDEVLEEGSQMQKDEAKRLLAETSG